MFAMPKDVYHWDYKINHSVASGLTNFPIIKIDLDNVISYCVILVNFNVISYVDAHSNYTNTVNDSLYAKKKVV